MLHDGFGSSWNGHETRLEESIGQRRHRRAETVKLFDAVEVAEKIFLRVALGFSGFR
jgi:hypothetical protein